MATKWKRHRIGSETKSHVHGLENDMCEAYGTAVDWSANWICPLDECEVTWEWCVEVVSVIYVDDDGFEFGSSKLESYSLAS